jgi:rsbT co-antagonist protein RsbR
MAVSATSRLYEVLQNDQNGLLNEWTAEQLKSGRRDQIKDSELREQCSEFLRLLKAGIASGSIEQVDGPAWAELRRMLEGISRTRAQQGFSPSETATFVFSFKGPLFSRLRAAHGNDAQALADDVWAATLLLDRLGLWTTEAYQKGREEVIVRQREDMLELSTPVISLWDGILALPVIGTLDSARSQIVMESLLQRIVETGASIANIDNTGVPTVDTLTAQHLLKTVSAARLMGADCIISGIRPQIAQTIVHLGVDLNEVTTKASLSSAFAVALERRRLTIVRATSGRAAGQG